LHAFDCGAEIEIHGLQGNWRRVSLNKHSNLGQEQR
jgi:hypothetical protein